MEDIISKKILEKLNSIDHKLAEHDKKFDSIDKRFVQIQEDISKISQSVAVIEDAHGRKIDTILQHYSVFYDKHASYHEKLSKLENKTDLNSWEIDQIKMKIS